MNTFLRVTIGDTDGDGNVRLDAAVQCNGFTGNSSAWFSISQLKEYSNHLQAYPLPSNGYSLQGGFWNKASPGQIDQLHVSFKAYPVGLRGAVGFLVTLREHLNEEKSPTVPSVIEVELRTSYQALVIFSRSLTIMLLGHVSETVLSDVEI